MPANKRTKFQREHDLEIVTRLYCKGVTQREIAERLGVSREQVKYDIKQLQKRWRESEVAMISELKARELTKIDNLEYEAWEAFERSKRDHVKLTDKTVEGGKDGDKTETGKVTEGQYGDPRFLQIIATCVDKRCQILGLDAPVKVEDVTPPRPVELMTKEEIESKIAEIIGKNGIKLPTAGTAHALN